MSSSTVSSRHSLRTIGLCFLVALLEGLDLQATGIAAPYIASEFGLSPASLGWLFSAGLIGLLPGAVVGGGLADRFGRKSVLIGAVLLFGLFSLLTAHSSTYEGLLAARLVTGLGLGAALPILIALSSETVDEHLRSTAVSLTYCGVPLGGAMAGLIGMFSVSGDWRLVFYVGGFAPLLIAFLLVLWLPESRAYRGRPGAGASMPLRTTASSLFSQGRGRGTLLLWASCFLTLTTLYMLLNGLPTLLLERGMSRLNVATIQALFNVGGAAGTLLAGFLMDRQKSFMAVGLAYLGMLVSLAALGTADQLQWLLLAGLLAGACAVGGQLILYALAPRMYPADIRATGVGVAVAVGRLGSMTGPLVAGQLLAAGTGVGGLLLAASPVVVLAAVTAAGLINRNGAEIGLAVLPKA